MKVEKLIGSVEKKYYWIVAAVLTAISTVLVFAYQGMLGGDYLLIRSDLVSGSIAVIKDNARSILAGDNIFFSFSIGMGLDNALAVASNFLSPYNILYLIFYNANESLITGIIIVLKLASAAASFQVFSKKVIKNDSFSSVIVSVFYALCAFSVAYGTIHIMWLDAVIILPILCVALVECIDSGKRTFLVVLYVYLFIAQFYMAYMVGMFSLLFVICYLACLHPYKETVFKLKVKEFISIFFNWVLSGVVAVMLSAIIWAPVLFFIIANRAEDSSAIEELSISLLQIINSFFWGNGYGINGDYAYIYCGTAVLLFAPLFFVSKKIRIKEKIFWSVILLFMLLCTVLTPLNSFMHVFDQPDNFWYRYSFIISFIACSIVAKTLSVSLKDMNKTIKIVFSAIVIFYLLEQQFAPMVIPNAAFNPRLNTTLSFIFNVLFILGWMFIVYFSSKCETKRVLLAVLAGLLVVVETSTSSIFEIPQKELADRYNEWYDTMEKTVSEIKASDSGLYRTICTNCKYSNSDTMFGYNGIEDFGDEEKYVVREFLSNIGFGTSTRWTSESGYTPVSNMLLGIKYNILLPNENMEMEAFENLDKQYIENPEALSLGYMVGGDIVLYEYSGRNAFENMNELVTAMTGDSSDCFVPIPEENIIYDEMGITYSKPTQQNYAKFKLTENTGDLFLTVKNDGFDDVYMQVEVDEPGNYLYDYDILGVENCGTSDYPATLLSTVNKMSYNKEKDKYNLVIHGEMGASPEEQQFENINFYSFDKENFEKHQGELAKQQLIVNEWKQGYVKGIVNVIDDKRLMFTSIPYDPGWHIYIDGEETETVRLVNGAFLGVFLPNAGEHEIELKYEVPGLKIGAIVSACGILAFLAVAFEKKLKKNNKETSK